MRAWSQYHPTRQAICQASWTSQAFWNRLPNSAAKDLRGQFQTPDRSTHEPSFLKHILEPDTPMPLIPLTNHSIFLEEAGSGESLVFLSGLGGDHRAFTVAQRHFAPRFRTIAIDNRDVGQSSRLDGGYTIHDMAQDLADVLDHLEIPVAHLVGHSLGGMIAQEFTLSWPERVRSLVLASTHCGGDPWRHAVLESWILQRHRLSAPEFAAATLPWLVAPAFFASAPAQLEGLIRFAEKNPWPQDPSAFERQARAAMSFESRTRAGSISASTLVLVGQADLVNPPRNAWDLARTIPNSQFEELPDLGHLPHVEDSRAFRTALERFYLNLGLI